MRAIADVASNLGLSDPHWTGWGSGVAKVDPAVLQTSRRGAGRLILVSAITPTPAGEGKTTTTIALGQALSVIGERACVAVREPSLGPVFGVKGGGTGGGASRVVPSDRIDLHLTGDLHAVTSANNLLSALVDNHLHFRKQPTLDTRRITWKRVLDMNDRSLRNVMVGLQGNGAPREAGFDITAASEIMAILCLSNGLDDLRERLGRILVGYGPDGVPVRASELKAAGAMTALLRDAIHPNLVQTTEGTPALVHGGPFANIAHGCNSILATQIAMHHADWTVTEAGFAFDLGGEKFLHLKCPAAGIDPDVVVLVATVRALKYHGGMGVKELAEADPERVEAGVDNLRHHIEAVRRFGKEPVVALNRFGSDTDEEIEVVRRAAEAAGANFAVHDGFGRGGQGAVELARAVVAAAEEVSPLTPIADPDGTVDDKVNQIVRGVYGGTGAVLSRRARGDLRRLKRLGLDRLPVCMAKTQSSISADPRLRNRPTGFEVPVQRLIPSAGAGFVVALAGDIVRMPGLPREPAAERWD